MRPSGWIMAEQARLVFLSLFSLGGGWVCREVGRGSGRGRGGRFGSGGGPCQVCRGPACSAKRPPMGLMVGHSWLVGVEVDGLWVGEGGRVREGVGAACGYGWHLWAHMVGAGP